MPPQRQDPESLAGKFFALRWLRGPPPLAQVVFLLASKSAFAMDETVAGVEDKPFLSCASDSPSALVDPYPANPFVTSGIEARPELIPVPGR